MWIAGSPFQTNNITRFWLPRFASNLAKNLTRRENVGEFGVDFFPIHYPDWTASKDQYWASLNASLQVHISTFPGSWKSIPDWYKMVPDTSTGPTGGPNGSFQVTMGRFQPFLANSSRFLAKNRWILIFQICWTFLSCQTFLSEGRFWRGAIQLGSPCWPEAQLSDTKRPFLMFFFGYFWRFLDLFSTFFGLFWHFFCYFWRFLDVPSLGQDLHLEVPSLGQDLHLALHVLAKTCI